MQAVIIAAGESSRCWPLNNQHKSQIKILGKSLIYWTIKSLSEKGIKDIVAVVGPNSSLKEESDIFKDLNINLSFVVQEKPLGTGNAIFQARNLIKEPFFVFWPYKINAGDIAENILEKYKDDKSELILVGNKTNTPWDYGVLKREGDKVVGITENPKPGEEPSNIKILGTYFLDPNFFEHYNSLKEHNPEDFVDVLNIYIKNKKASFVFWEEELPSLKYPWQLLDLLRIKFKLGFENYISSNALIGKSVVIDGNVHIGDSAIIGENTLISGPCYIGNNCKIGSNNVLRGPISLGEGVITGAFAEVKNSIIGEGTHLHSGYVGDSIIGQGCRFGAGFITGNRRIDRGNIKCLVKDNKVDTGLTYFGCVVGNNSCFGIKSGTMPGVFIGSGCTVGPGTLVFENIKDNSRVSTDFKSVQKE